MAQSNLIQLASVKQRFILPALDAELYAEVLEGYVARRRSQRHQDKSVLRDLAVVEDFLKFVGKAPWYWTEGDFEKWCEHLFVERELRVSSQRVYQSAIRNFLEYLCHNIKFSTDIHRHYGIHLRQICTSENCIPHTTERELGRERPAFTHVQIEQFFGALDEAIQLAAQSSSKDLRPLQRDKALFYTIYVGGLRASEALALNLTSFQPNPAIPALGNFGFMSVWGKGSRGSGPRHRTVPIDHEALPPLLEWYVEKIRKHFLLNADPNENALFLSERGNRLGLSTLEYRFQHLLQIAGLEGLGFTPHCLRHSSITHETVRGMSGEAVRRKSGHTNQATTQIYTHVGDEFINNEFNEAVGKQINSVERKDQYEKQ